MLGLLALPAASKPPEDWCRLLFLTTASKNGFSSGLLAQWKSAKRAPANASATLATPRNLGFVSPTTLAVDNFGPESSSPKQMVRFYWGNFLVKPKEQPEIRGVNDTPASDYFPKGGSRIELEWSQLQTLRRGPVKLDPTSKVSGDYLLQATHLGTVRWSLKEKQQVLPPIQLVQPAKPEEVDTSKGFELAWKAVPNVIGYTVVVEGRDSAGRRSAWENQRYSQSFLVSRPLDRKTNSKLIPSNSCSCKIPAGIFRGWASVIITGYAPSVAGKGPVQAWATSQTSYTLVAGKT